MVGSVGEHPAATRLFATPRDNLQPAMLWVRVGRTASTCHTVLAILRFGPQPDGLRATSKSRRFELSLPG